MFKEPKLDYLPKRPSKWDYGIGLIGVGGIAEIGHIPAYMKAGYRIVAVADPIESRREYAENMIGIGKDKQYSDHRDLLDRSDVQIVDITIPQSSPNKISVVHDAIDAGKHIMVEKPLSMNYKEAKGMVMHAKKMGVKMTICHQYRWMPVYRSIKNLIDQHYLGELFFLSIDERWDYDLPGSYDKQPQMLLMMQTVHFVDEFRWWTGREPRQIFASLSRRPKQHIIGESIGTLIMDFDKNLRSVYLGNVATHSQSQHHHIRIEGTGGIINAQHNNLWSPGSLEYSQVGAEDFWYRPQLEGESFTDGYIGLMGDLMEAISEDREPVVSGQDNLKTMQVIFAAYKSAELGRAVKPSEIDSD